MDINLFTTHLSGEAAAPDLRDQFTNERSQATDEVIEH